MLKVQEVPTTVGSLEVSLVSISNISLLLREERHFLEKYLAKLKKVSKNSSTVYITRIFIDYNCRHVSSIEDE